MLPCNRRPVPRRVQGQIALPVALGHLHQAELFAGEREVEVRVSEVGVQGGRITEQDEGRLVLAPIMKHVPEVEARLGVRRLELDGPLEASYCLVETPLPN